MSEIPGTKSNPFQAQESDFRLSNGKRLLARLFFETSPADKTGVKYTLKEIDHLGYPSIHRLYLEASDPTEYNFALAYFESWSHWEVLCECNWFKPYITRWRRELEIKMKSEALARISIVAKSGGKETLAANRFLLEKGWEPKDGSKRGRPSKDEIKAEADRILSSNSDINSDFNRIMKVQ